VRNLYELLERRATRYPLAAAVGGQEGLSWRTLTSRDLLGLVDRLAAELAGLGVSSGDRVVVWLPNHWRTPVYLFAAWKLGAIVVPFDREMNPEAGASILDSVEPRSVLVGYDERPAWAAGRELTAWWEPGRRGGTPMPDWTAPAEELAAIFFTSGTTGNPKGCMISHANVLSQVVAAHERIPLDPMCRLASILPLSHLFELTCGLVYPLDSGAAVHYIPSRRGPDIVRVLSEQRITHMMAVPQLLQLMGQSLDQQLRAALPQRAYAALIATAERLPLAQRRALFWMVHRKIGGQFRLLAAGGAALAVETQRLWERLGVRVVQGYGTSECSPIIACGRPDGSTPPGSVGPPIQGVTVRLRAAAAETGEKTGSPSKSNTPSQGRGPGGAQRPRTDAPFGASARRLGETPEGELLVKGPNVMRGYWKDPAKTAEVLSEDGWYATGDLGRIDQQGNLWLVGRARDLIVLPSGLNVWPQDIEEVLRADEAVRDAAVVAVPTPSGGASLHAYLLGKPGADLTSIVARANARLALHQRLASASWWPEADFPRTAGLGKVRRHLLPVPEAAQGVSVQTFEAADDPVGLAIAGAARVPAVQAGQRLGDLGLDSLGLVELALALEEKTGRSIADGDLRPDMSVDEVRQLVARAPAVDQVAGPAREAVPPLWVYTWGRPLRRLSLPFDLLYRAAITRTAVLGAEHLAHLPGSIVLAGTHHSFADIALVRFGLSRTPARGLERRLVIAAGAGGEGWRSPLARYGVVAFGLYPLQQVQDRDASLRGLVRIAQTGNAVLIFPQGTHARPEQERAGDPEVRFRPGVAHLAMALGASVVPFGLAGTERVMPPYLDEFHGLVVAGIPVSIKRRPLAIAFGPPLTLEPGEEPQAFAERLQEVCYGLTRQAEQALA
jgi:long-chain acyl-CoA synthetase